MAIFCLRGHYFSATPPWEPLPHGILLSIDIHERHASTRRPPSALRPWIGVSRGLFVVVFES